MNLLKNGSYKICKSVNPLNLMIAEVKRTVISIFGSYNYHKDEELGVNQFQLYVTNPAIPRLYCLPKIHKARKQMRTIVSCINSPVEKISKFLVTKFKCLKPPITCSVKNSFEFVEKRKGVIIDEDEVMVSFDVSSLFPSLPRAENLELVIKWIEEQDISSTYKEKLSILTKICVKNNFFSFRGVIYEQIEGNPMGMALSVSPIFAEVYIIYVVYYINSIRNNILTVSYCAHNDHTIFKEKNQSTILSNISLHLQLFESP